jgi:hypothetical protein
MRMSRRLATVIAILLLAAPARATELDRMRAFDRARQDARAAFDHEFEELRRLEPERIRAQDGRVLRQGDELALKLDNGGRMFLRNDDSMCLEGIIPARNDGCVAFFFVGHAQRFYLLRARYDAGSDYRLIDDGTGASTIVPAEPHFSPDGRHLVTVCAENAYDPVGIEIWSLGAGEPSREWTHQPQQYAVYSFVRWDGNASIALEVKTYVDHDLKQLPARLVLGDGGWMLEGPPESSRY